MLITMKASIEAMRGLLYIAGEALDLSYGHPDHSVREHNLEFLQLITPVCKAWCTDMGVRLSSIGLQVHGGMGYVEETGVAQVYRDARITPIYEGTNGIQAVDLVGRKVPMLNGDVARELFARVESDADSLGTSNGRLKDIRENLVAALDSLREATDWLLAAEHHRDRLAGASPYLEMFGLVAGGWVMARSAAKAGQLLASGEGDADFLNTKVATCRFYCDQILPQATGLLPAVTSGAGQLSDAL